ncbi:Uncharacterised protein [Mycobacteroides abscessus subsp. abscessus]|nr:Uncharacterised protein [Mycobacteroides abscessus subsp. abscessus]
MHISDYPNRICFRNSFSWHKRIAFQFSRFNGLSHTKDKYQYTSQKQNDSGYCFLFHSELLLRP